MKKMLYRTIKISALIILVLGGFIAIKAQDLPDAAGMPAGKGAWVVEQKYKTSIGGSYLRGYIYVIVQSDGTVFHRKFFDTWQPATGWCQDKFTAAEMRDIKGAVASSKSGAWDASYGPFINVLGEFRALIMTMRDVKGKIVEHKTTLWRFYDLPADIVKITNAVDAAGDLAFSNCQNSAPVKVEKTEDKTENGATIYAVNQAGDLLWYNHTGFANGARIWANNAKAKNVGHEWSSNIKVFKGDPRGKDGIVYTVSKGGFLNWYKHNGFASGLSDWETPKNVGSGFNGQQVFSGGGGVIYLINDAGELYWYKHLGYQFGEKTWANNGAGKKVGNVGWKDARFVFSGGSGVIYMIDNQGDLYWSKHLGFADGTNKWQERRKVGSGWTNFRQVFSAGGGIIYALKIDGALYWYLHQDYSGSAPPQANNLGAGKEIGTGWNFNFVF